jgi:hypothetical protein
MFDSQRESFLFKYHFHEVTEIHIVVNHEDTVGLHVA